MMVPFGDAALRFDRPPGSDVAALLALLRQWPGVIDAVVTERHCCISFAPGRIPPDVETLAVRCATATAPPAAPRRHVISVRYDGADLQAAASAANMAVEQLIELHRGREYVVAMLGFQPGFAYLAGLDPRLVLPRRATPRTRVPRGSVAIGGPYTGVYPFDSPGGWHLLGTAPEFVAFGRESSTLQPGDRVRFERA